MISFAIFALYLLCEVQAWVPNECAGNLTNPNAVCCPTPAGYRLPCGGPLRGVCRQYQTYKEYPPAHRIYDIDSRMNWPKKFFTYGCQCRANFRGVGCQLCWFGREGRNCTRKRLRVRKEIFSLTDAQRQRFIALMDLSRRVFSDHKMVIEQNNSGADPLRDAVLKNVSIHYMLVALHRFASRHTLFINRTTCDQFGKLDFNHNGPTFITWHRYFMLLWEAELQRLERDFFHENTFAMPYWDWTDATSCEVCRNDMIGQLGARDRFGRRLHRDSRFHTWNEFCPFVPVATKCFGCHVATGFGKLTRHFKNSTFPTSGEIRKLLTLRTFYESNEDYVKCKTFHVALEGFCGFTPSDKYLWMHNRVHNFVDGTFLSSSTSVNDPLFVLHHLQLDRLVQAWFMKHRPHYSEMPTMFVHSGHCRDCNMVGFLPPLPHKSMFVDTKSLGYTYDNYRFGKSTRVIQPPKTKFKKRHTHNTYGDEYVK